MTSPSHVPGVADALHSTSRAEKSQPLVAVVGRPNVGKSSLVNRIVGRRATIVEESPGVTRDRRSLEADWNGRSFTVVDTGGWMERGDALDRKVGAQAERAVREADLVLFVVDAQVGPTGEDEEVARILRRAPCPVLVVANKVDSQAQESDAWAVGRLGMGGVWMISALHGRGVGDVLDEVVRLMAAPETVPHDGSSQHDDSTPQALGEQPLGCPSVAVIGRPNVGKSTLFNRLIGDERSITHELPGTTRDLVDTVVQTDAGRMRFVDTAGLRRKSRVGAGPEYYSVVRALHAIEQADVALLLIDATDGVAHQDQRLAERIDAAGSPTVIVLNKWEMANADDRARVIADVEDRLGFLGYSPVVKLSALTGRGVHRLLPAVSEALAVYHRRLPTRKVNEVVQAAQAAHAAPGARILYAVQGAVDPPTFTLFTNRTLPRSYLRYIERKLREHFDLGPTPLKLRVRRRSR